MQISKSHLVFLGVGAAVVMTLSIDKVVKIAMILGIIAWLWTTGRVRNISRVIQPVEFSQLQSLKDTLFAAYPFLNNHIMKQVEAQVEFYLSILSSLNNQQSLPHQYQFEKLRDATQLLLKELESIIYLIDSTEQDTLLHCISSIRVLSKKWVRAIQFRAATHREPTVRQKNTEALEKLPSELNYLQHIEPVLFSSYKCCTKSL